MREFMNITEALADESRIRLRFALRDGELCACQPVEFPTPARSKVSKHLPVLDGFGRVGVRKEGRWGYDSFPGTSAPPTVRSTLKRALQSAEDPSRLGENAQHRMRMLRLDPADLCQSQCKR